MCEIVERWKIRRLTQDVINLTSEVYGEERSRNVMHINFKEKGPTVRGLKFLKRQLEKDRLDKE